MKALKHFIQIATIFGLLVLFIMYVEPGYGVVPLAKAGLLGFFCITAWYTIGWLFDWSQSPDIPAKVLNPVYVHPYRKEALRLACGELKTFDLTQITIVTGLSKEHDCSYLYVHDRYNKKRESKVYYYNKADKDMSHSL